MSETARNQQEWENTVNGSRMGSYRSANATRAFVPNRVRFIPWTINFAHPRACPRETAAILAGGALGLNLGGAEEAIQLTR